MQSFDTIVHPNKQYNRSSSIEEQQVKPCSLRSLTVAGQREPRIYNTSKYAVPTLANGVERPFAGTVFIGRNIAL